MWVPGLGLVKSTGRAAAGTAKGTVGFGRGLYRHVAEPITRRSLQGAGWLADKAAGGLVEHPLRTLLVGGTLLSAGSAVARGIDRHSQVRNSVSYRYF